MLNQLRVQMQPLSLLLWHVCAGRGLKDSKTETHRGLGRELIPGREGRWPTDCIHIPSLQAKQPPHWHPSFGSDEDWEEEREGRAVLDEEAKVAFLYLCWLPLQEQPHLSKHDEKRKETKGERGRNRERMHGTEPEPLYTICKNV